MSASDYPAGAYYDDSAPWNEKNCEYCTDGYDEDGEPCGQCNNE